MNHKMWNLAQKGILCDLKLIEDGPNNETNEHSVHRVVVYAASPFFETFMTSGFKDQHNDRITIPTSTPGCLHIVLNAIYIPSIAESLYMRAVEDGMNFAMALYDMCEYLLLEDHVEYIQKAIGVAITIPDIIKWVDNRNIENKSVPSWLTEHIITNLKNSVVIVRGKSYISIDVLTSIHNSLIFNEILKNFKQ